MKTAKPIEELEPGVLGIFRLFIGVQLAISLSGMIVHFLPPLQSPSEIIRHFRLIASETGIERQLIVLALVSALLFIYLSIPGLRRILKSYYLPIGILWATAGPIFAPYIEIHSIGNNPPELLLQSSFWQQIILLFIPLIVVAWQYSTRQVILFCVLTVVVNITLLLSNMVLIDPALLRSLLGIIFIQMVSFLLIGNMLANLVKSQREQRQRLTEANERLAQHASMVEQLTISQERNRMARELHDVLAHTLSGVAVELEGMRAMLRRDPEQANELLNHSLQAVREGLTETRRALQELRAKPLEELGVALAIQTLAESYANRSGFQLKLDIDHNLGEFPVDVQQSIYRIAQESLANIANHSQAQNACVTLKQDKNLLKLVIRDDGCGFDPNLAQKESHYGLVGMRERAEMVGGDLSLESEPGQGTQVSFWYGEADE